VEAFRDAALVAAAATHELRRAVLRGGDPSAVVTFEGDDEPTTFHLALLDDEGEVPLAVATFLARPTPVRPGGRATQLRGMAVAARQQGRGLGATLLAAGVALARARGDEVLWANARDTAVGFYERLGWSVAGEGFVDATTGLPHHVVLLDLTA
jgi:GNAT superfamily N-acetyltransferase